MTSDIFYDYNYNGIRDSTFINLIYDTTLGFRIWKGQYLRDENSTPYRINPWQWNIETAPSPMMWLYFDYYGLHLVSFMSTSESYFNYFSGDPVGQNIYLLPNSNIEGGYEGEGNIDIDPQFYDSNNDNYTLQSYYAAL